MQNANIWNMLSKHLAGEESPDENKKFIKWFDDSENNKALFYKVKNAWEDSKEIKDESQLTFRERFTKQKIKKFILNQAIGNFVGFIVGMWATAMFSHYVLERRGLQNLFGLTGRKKVVVNEIPEWLQSGIAILVGFITLEFINHFFQTKKHLMVIEYLKKKYTSFATKR